MNVTEYLTAFHLPKFHVWMLTLRREKNKITIIILKLFYNQYHNRVRQRTVVEGIIEKRLEIK